MYVDILSIILLDVTCKMWQDLEPNMQLGLSTPQGAEKVSECNFRAVDGGKMRALGMHSVWICALYKYICTTSIIYF